MTERKEAIDLDVEMVVITRNASAQMREILRAPDAEPNRMLRAVLGAARQSEAASESFEDDDGEHIALPVVLVVGKRQKEAIVSLTRTARESQWGDRTMTYITSVDEKAAA